MAASDRDLLKGQVGDRAGQVDGDGAEAEADGSVGLLDVVDGEPGDRSGPLGTEEQQQAGEAVFGLEGVVVEQTAGGAPVRGKRGRPRHCPDVVLADRGYDHDKYRRLVWDLGAKPQIARRGTEHGSGLGTQRWVVERAFAHLHWFRRLRIRWDIRDDIHEAFLSLACSIICWRRLKKLRPR